MFAQYLRFPGGRAKALTLSYDDGVEQDIRLAELMRRYDVCGAFNINSGLFAPEGTVHPAGQIHRRMTAAQCLALYQDPRFEVAVHGVHHPSLDRIPASTAMAEVVEDRRALEAMFGGLVRGMAYPNGHFNQEVVEMLRLAGVAYARTTFATERFDLPHNWLTLDPTCHHDHPRLHELTETFLSAKAEREPMLFYLWGHSYEFEMHDNWTVIERFLEQVSGKPEVWYCTNIALYDYVQAYRQLVWSADGHTLHNPSAQTVWLQVDGLAVQVSAGETRRI